MKRIAESKLATRLQRYMKKEGLDYRGLADRLGVSLSQAHDWATGNGEPRLDNIAKITGRLKIKLSELV